MKKFLVIGNPINHSLSPKLHNYWINQNKVKAIWNKLIENNANIILLSHRGRPKGEMVSELSLKPIFNLGVAPFLLAETFKILLLSLLVKKLIKLKDFI